jgi:hypothetical protein
MASMGFHGLLFGQTEVSRHVVWIEGVHAVETIQASVTPKDYVVGDISFAVFIYGLDDRPAFFRRLLWSQRQMALSCLPLRSSDSRNHRCIPGGGRLISSMDFAVTRPAELAFVSLC